MRSSIGRGVQLEGVHVGEEGIAKALPHFGDVANTGITGVSGLLVNVERNAAVTAPLGTAVHAEATAAGWHFQCVLARPIRTKNIVARNKAVASLLLHLSEVLALSIGHLHFLETTTLHATGMASEGTVVLSDVSSPIPSP